MDIFGISVALKASMDQLFRSSRGSGRTTHLAKHTDSRHLIIFETVKQQRHFIDVAKTVHKCPQDLPNTFVFDDFSAVHMLPKFCPSVLTHHVVFDHSWLETYYQFHLFQISNSLNLINNQSKMLLPDDDLKTIPKHELRNMSLEQFNHYLHGEFKKETERWLNRPFKKK